jgi:hypothetical protein
LRPSSCVGLLLIVARTEFFTMRSWLPPVVYRTALGLVVLALLQAGAHRAL